MISTVRTGSYDRAELTAAVRRHFDALDVWSRLDPDTRVLLKPNLLMKREPHEATTTHPALVEAVALVLRERGIHRITIADSPGGPYTPAALEGIYKATGMAAVAAETGCTLNRDTGYQEVESAVAGGLCRSFELITPVCQADFIINLPRLKTHAMTTLSGGVKNLFGCIPGLQKPAMHFRFPQRDRFGRMLAELARTVAPGLSIVDAVVAMEGDGPSAGTPRFTGWTLAADDPFALDRALCVLTGISPNEVPYLNVEDDLRPLTWAGDRCEPWQPPFRTPASREVDFSSHLPRPLLKLGKRLLSPRPVIRREDCIGCGKCRESCPAQALDIREKKAMIRYRRCIRCYCCHEMCPVRAIDIRRRRLPGIHGTR